MKTWIDISYTQKPRTGYAYMKHASSGECKWMQTGIEIEEPIPTPIIKKTSTRGKKK